MKKIDSITKEQKSYATRRIKEILSRKIEAIRKRRINASALLMKAAKKVGLKLKTQAELRRDVLRRWRDGSSAYLEVVKNEKEIRDERVRLDQVERERGRDQIRALEEAGQDLIDSIMLKDDRNVIERIKKFEKRKF